jgi:DNA invertase Pin-like site-specific DNA recombinase
VIEEWCRELELDRVELVREHEPEPGAGRPGLDGALRQIDAGDAGCLIVSDLERLSREVGELAGVIDRLERAGIRLIAADVGLDTATPSGQLAIEPRKGAEPIVDEATAEPEPDWHPSAPELVAAPPEVAPAAPAPRESAAAPPEPMAAPLEAVADPPETVATPPVPAPAVVKAFGYASVPLDGNPATELDEQKRAIEASAARLGIQLVEVVRERESKDGKALERAGLSYLIERVAMGDATCVVVAGLDRLSRVVTELGTIVQWLDQNEVRLIALDLQLDTATSAGRTTARALASVGGWERERIAERTRRGLAAARAKRHAAAEPPGGADWPAIRRRIAAMRADGMTLQAIADVLNAEGVPTQRGGVEWRPSSVQTAAGYKRRSQLKRLPHVDRGAPSQPPPEGGSASD